MLQQKRCAAAHILEHTMHANCQVAMLLRVPSPAALQLPVSLTLCLMRSSFSDSSLVGSAMGLGASVVADAACSTATAERSWKMFRPDRARELKRAWPWPLKSMWWVRG